MNRNFLDKLKSRKLWVAVIAILSGVCMAFFDISESDIVEAVSKVSGAIAILGGAVAYINGEAKIDAAASVPIIFPAIEEESEPENDTGEE
jgi:hypothetical protein